MIYSMTGYGSSYVESELGIFTIEIKSINNRFLDIVFRLSPNLSFLESHIKNKMVGIVKRGKLDVFIRWYRKGEALPELEINAFVLEKIYRDSLAIQKNLGIPGTVSIGDFLHIPSLYQEIPPRLDEKKLWDILKKGVQKALQSLQHSRRKEGAHLAKALLSHLDELETEWAKLEDLNQEVLEQFRQRLSKKIEEFNKIAATPVDEQRLDAEALLFADKSDITEEIARLSAHIKTFRDLLNSKDNVPMGKQMEFLCQELHREVNTIGSKSRGTSLSNLALSMKNIVEKIREQIQNVE
ncbi:YicC family protein [Candidatus Sumerlaeota bacterium]|nr:YicC family protein [Candidatus Sumerlaeota bacterium]